ncbi:MAG: MFS transporter [Muribaculaceae bacterium]|nr:MFS transporter [Muribaculaceae bacterium]
MKEIIIKKLNESSAARWTVLMIVAFTMMTGYIVAKEMSPLQYLLELPASEGGMGWTSGEFGLFAGSRGFFNVFFLMLFVGGIILDKTGVRFAGTLSCVLMLIGTAIDYYAIAFASPEPTSAVNMPLFGIEGTAIKHQVLLAALGFAIFGIGYELCGITVSKVIVKWFSGREMALAMGIQVALARLGTALALAGSPAIARHFSLSTPILLGLLSVGVGLIAYLFYCVMDTRFDKENVATSDDAEDEKFHFSDMLVTVKNSGFWLITLLCMLYYSALYPFLDFATKLMIAKYGVNPDLAGTIPAILPFTSIVLTPLFGAMYDRVGRGATIMIVGTVMLTVVLMVFTLPAHASWIAVVMMLVLGVAFSLLPSVLWPAVPKIVPMKQLGTAYSIIYYIQNIGLMLIPIVIGGVLQRNTAADGSVDYTTAMWIFTGIGIAAIIIALLLRRADSKHQYGLETPKSLT